MSGVWPFVLVAVSMAFKDCFGTLMVVAEAKGRDNYAALLDAAGDAAVFFTTLYCVGPAITRGLTGHTMALLADMMVVSAVGTKVWTRVGRRIKQSGR